MGFLSKIFHRNRLELKNVTEEKQEKPFVSNDEEEAAEKEKEEKKTCNSESSPFLDDC